MNQQKIGSFLQSLRRQQGWTQEQLAERMGVSRRTVSRWETGSNLPDLSLLPLLADLYGVELRELLDGERKEEAMNQELQQTVRKVADYGSEEKRRLLGRLHKLAWAGLAAALVFTALFFAGRADGPLGSVCLGSACGILAVGVVATSPLAPGMQRAKQRLLRSLQKESDRRDK